ncbi:3-oxoacyl-[acyl-carrier-protein] reductase [Brochothrix thermosphacta]|uniref:3-oxoacyl-[acyl-carrier-protein] reductase n=1 Tax=Brochothrix thermosphacta TaxID=2756 RepID=UPI0003E8A319|nr:3-oxoacyl-[acyl-carrier-protein] reductase [Brochothrix thermosphacta]EUJ35634.1 3-oxoacyl-ACP reductase [Brochothrix thermosphacta DSM 20171 = FSL F6-1036]ODJ51853.1 3-oxoacyl-[acyl-carrier-protein] reductase [Brochothrix thermosphacta DSM 20171 = FSL F6-1036]
MELTNKVAIVTGASRGIGQEIAYKLASLGAKIVVNYAGNVKAADETVAKIKADYNTEAIAVQANVADEDDVKRLFKETLDTFGGIDILINNAGITRDNLLMRMKAEEFDDVINANLRGTFLCLKAAARPMMKKRQGTIVNMTSVVGITGNAGQANYVASKAGVIGLTKTASRELAPRGIRVNAVAPGFIDTDMTDVLPEEVKSGMLSQIPLGAMGNTKNVADVVAFLVSDASAYMTGQTLSVDGGMSM